MHQVDPLIRTALSYKAVGTIYVHATEKSKMLTNIRLELTTSILR